MKGRRPWAALWTILAARLPSRCLLCPRPAARSLVCAPCATQLPWLPAARCPVCATPRTAGEETGDLPCGACLAHPPAFDATLASFAYAGAAGQLVRGLKFRSRLASAEFFAASLPTPPDDLACLIPVPLAPSRLAERGYNQALEIARSLAQRQRITVDADSLLRERETPHQIGLPWRERERNLKGAFTCTRHFDGLHVGVVDDVMTSGATLGEIAKTLKSAGAARVTNLIAARTLRDAAQA